MLPALAYASIGLQLGGNLLAAGENYDAMVDDAKALEFQAAKAVKEGRDMAKKIRRQGETVLGTAEVELATSGFRMDTAQSMEIRDEIVKNVEYDAMNAVLSGDLQSMALRKQARAVRAAAKKGRGLGIVTGVAGAGAALFGASR